MRCKEMIDVLEIIEKMKRYRMAVGVVENAIVEVDKAYNFDNGFWELRVIVICNGRTEKITAYRGIEKKVDEKFDELIEKYGLVEGVDITDLCYECGGDGE